MKKLYSIYDKAAGAFCAPFQMLTDAQALRAFESNLANPQTNIHQFPEDYDLYFVGQFDDNSGELQYEDPSKIASGLETAARLKKQDENQTSLELTEPE